MNDALNYDRCVSSNIFANQSDIPSISISFDLKQFNIDKTVKPLHNYKLKNKKKFLLVKSLGEKNYFNLMKYAKLMLGKCFPDALKPTKCQWET